ncbi:uncharacterized protein C11orf86 homolog isoform X3 [Perognathus longimembris pacificus]|uniref:uncharacterized protein C11orf86 homolog isoform X3 n=1 Tax=Perognathus longimembris pacificus TaxID=214514 RepID=UPI002018EE3E|nr:uncharacterized protein C11orf86 homolog isoform X3 [Perognathus longimembris pacificus]
MGTGLRSQSLRGPRPSYGKLQEPRGTPRRALSLRLGQEKAKSQGLDGGTEGLDTPVSERLSGTLEDTEQLIQAQRGGSRRWLRQYRQRVGVTGVCHHTQIPERFSMINVQMLNG